MLELDDQNRGEKKNGSTNITRRFFEEEREVGQGAN